MCVCSCSNENRLREAGEGVEDLRDLFMRSVRKKRVWLISRGPVSRTRPRDARVPVDNTLQRQLFRLLSPSLRFFFFPLLPSTWSLSLVRSLSSLQWIYCRLLCRSSITLRLLSLSLSLSFNVFFDLRFLSRLSLLLTFSLVSTLFLFSFDSRFLSRVSRLFLSSLHFLSFSLVSTLFLLSFDLWSLYLASFFSSDTLSTFNSSRLLFHSLFLSLSLFQRCFSSLSIFDSFLSFFLLFTFSLFGSNVVPPLSLSILFLLFVLVRRSLSFSGLFLPPLPVFVGSFPFCLAPKLEARAGPAITEVRSLSADGRPMYGSLFYAGCAALRCTSVRALRTGPSVALHGSKHARYIQRASWPRSWISGRT